MSRVIKTIIWLVLQHFRPLIHDCLHIMYQVDIVMEDTIIYLLLRAYTQLEKLQSTVRIMFFDFFRSLKCSRREMHHLGLMTDGPTVMHG